MPPPARAISSQKSSGKTELLLLFALRTINALKNIGAAGCYEILRDF
jgi:hypothetical protein